jgi:signal transduction histidine kinase
MELSFTKKVPYKIKILILSVVLVSIPAMILGYVNYNAARQHSYAQMEEKLTEQAVLVDQVVKRAVNELEVVRELTDARVKGLVKEQAEMVYYLTQKTKEKENLKDILSEITIGETGYIWILSYDGYYILSKKRTRDGEDIWNAKDANGWKFVQTMIKKARILDPGQLAFETYPWQNPGEKAPRKKIAALLHFPEEKWVMGISSYHDELYDASYREEVLEGIKKQLASISIGKLGYIWVLGGKGEQKGHYIVSKDRKRDGENIFNAKDSNGNPFIKEMIEDSILLSKPESEYKVGIKHYPWKNIGESEPRQKIAAYTYVPQLDWVVGTSAYEEDFLTQLENFKLQTAWIVLLSALVGSAVVFFTAEDIVASVTDKQGRPKRSSLINNR